jgi:hypothetical protein
VVSVGRERRAELKKRRVQVRDAPSNRTFGNCLLGFHCSQNHPAQAAPVLVFPSLQHANNEIYQQVIHSCWRAAPDPAKKTGLLLRTAPNSACKAMILSGRAGNVGSADMK